MKILAVDLGLARTGIAISDVNQILASPFCVIAEKNKEILLQKIHEICKKEKIEKIIVGLPRNMYGSEGESAKNCKDFASTLSDITNLPVTMVDERCTTITAHNFLNENNVRRKKRKNVVDSVAASVILQNYLDFFQQNFN